MPRVFNIAAACVMAAACTCSATDDWVVRSDGIGPINVGMRPADVKAALHLSYSNSMTKDSDQQTCFYLDLRDHSGVGLMILNGRVARVDIDNRNTQTVEGIHNGDSEARALSVYGKRMKVTPHAYTGPEGHYLTVRSADGKYGIRFETERGKIVRYYAGRVEAISYIEGCE